MASPVSSPLTTTSGAGAILTAAVDILYFAVTQHTVSPNIQADFLAIFSGVGLIFAKDFNISGGAAK